MRNQEVENMKLKRGHRILALLLSLIVGFGMIPVIGSVTEADPGDSFVYADGDPNAPVKGGYKGTWVRPTGPYDEASVRITKYKHGKIKGRFYVFHTHIDKHGDYAGRLEGSFSFSKKLGGKKSFTITKKIKGVKVTIKVKLNEVKVYSKNTLYYKGVKLKYTFKYKGRNVRYNGSLYRKRPTDEQKQF